MNGLEVGRQIQNAGRQFTGDAQQKVREFSPWVAWIGHLGFAAIGVVYILIGILAVQGASNLSGGKSGASGALSYIAELPHGQILLAIVAAGFVFYAIWRFTQALMDTDAKGSDAKGLAVRTGFAVIGVIYLGLAFSAVNIILGAGSSGGSSAQGWTAWLLKQPFGSVLVAAAGAAVIGAGLYFFYKAWSAKFRKTLLFSKMSEAEEKWGTRFGRLGFSARGVVYCIMGSFLIFAALHANPGEARDFSGALRVVENQSYGAYLLMLLAFGLFSYGVFMLFLAKYRRMVSTQEG